MEFINKLYQETPAMIISLFRMVLQPQGQIAKAINAVILLLAAMVMAWALFQATLILVAWFKLATLKKTIAKDKNKTWSPEDINSLVKRRSHTTRRFLEKLKTVHRLREDVNAVLESVDHLDASTRWRAYGILKYPISSLIIFGLLGTVWGLQKAIYSMLPTLQGTMDIDQLKAVMVGTLTGMQTAFATTLAGLICSIILGFFILVMFKTFIDRQLIKEKQFLVTKIIPIFSPISTEQLKRISDQTKELKGTVGDIANQSELLFQPIIESANGLKSSLDSFYSASHSMIEVSKTVQNFSDVLENSLSQLAHTMQGVSDSMGTFMSVQSDIEGTVKNLKHLPDHFDLLMKSLTEEFKKHQSEVQASSDRSLGQRIESLSEVITALSEESGKWRQENVDHVKTVTKAADGTFAQIKTEVSQLVDKFSETANRMDKVSDKVSRGIEALNDGQKQIGDAYLDAFKQKMDLIHSNFVLLIEQLSNDEQQRNQQIVNALTEWVAYNEFLSRMLNNMEQLPNLIGNAVAGKS